MGNYLKDEWYRIVTQILLAIVIMEDGRSLIVDSELSLTVLHIIHLKVKISLVVDSKKMKSCSKLQ